MKNIVPLVSLVVLLALLLLSTYTLREHEQALIIELGRVRGAPVTEAGLHWKVPFIQEAVMFEKRILQWDGDRGEIPTLDKKFIWVDVTARWRIDDALAFYKAVRDIPNAMLRMGTILDGVTRDTISAYNLIEVVRSSNKILEDLTAERNELTAAHAANDPSQDPMDDELLDELSSSIPTVKLGREKISELIAGRARKELANFGIYLIDVQIRSIAYKEVVEQKVYSRMVSERNKMATKIRSSGKGEEAKILGQLDLTLKKIESEAYRKAQEIRGHAEAESALIYAKALGQDPAYFEFVKTLDAYKTTLAKKGEFILSTDSAFLRLLNKGG